MKKSEHADKQVIIHENICSGSELANIIRADTMNGIYVRKGHLDIEMKGTAMRVEACSMLFVPISCAISITGESARLVCSLIQLSLTAISDILESPDIRTSLLLRVYDNPVFHLNNEEGELLNSYFKYAARIINGTNPNSFLCFKHLTLASYYGLFSSGLDLSKQKQNIFIQFLILVREHYKEREDIRYYSDSLCVSPQHLSQIVKSLSGKGPSFWINEAVISESKRLLALNRLPIKTIAFEMGFDSISYFSKYFKRQTGMNPSEYRDSLINK